MPLAPGARLGAYEVIAQIGEGGMGEVYRARDTTLRRDVALKLLPERFALDQDRITRFSREARILAGISHPNIAAVYGLERTEHGGQVLVLEFVEGDTLLERIRGGRLPIPEVLSIAKQITDALQAAHAAGIIHRDLKPSNIKVRPDGTIKVLDFGVAKALDTGAGIGGTNETKSLETQSGTLLGTAAYMSPEQARGFTVDKRTDIWSFGCVLYEMLTGIRAFGRKTFADTLAAIVERDPDWSHLPPATPAPLHRLLRRCLERDCTHRLHDIADARIELADAQTEMSLIGSLGVSQVSAPQPRPGSMPPWLALFLIPFAVGGLGLLISTVFNRTMGLSPRFGSENPGTWLYWGFKSLFAPLLLVLVLSGAIAILQTVLAALGRSVSARWSIARTIVRRTAERFNAVAAALRLNDPHVLAQVIAMFGAFALVGTLWRFSELIYAFWNPISAMPPERLARLADAGEINAYRITLTSLVFLLTFCALYVFRMRARLGVIGHTRWPRAGIGVLAASVVMLETPYRVFYFSDFERADFYSMLCYVIGENRVELLVHCPAMDPPRNRIVERNDPAVMRRGSRGRIF